MKIKAATKPNNPICTIKEWETNVRKTHWKAGRSARTLAEFVIGTGSTGQTGGRMEKILEGICNSIKELDGTVFYEAYPEFPVYFDKFAGPRRHDLGVFGATEKEDSVFAGIEAKVDEEFGGTVGDEYAKAKKEKKDRKAENKNSYKADRIEGLVAKYFSSKDIEPYANLRYQLLHGLAGTVEHNKTCYPEPAYSLFLIIVFKTNNFTSKDNYDKNKGSQNYDDYNKFLKALKAKKVNTNKIPLSYVKDNKIYKIPIGGKSVYSAYVEIDAENGKTEYSYQEAGKKVTL